MTSTCSSSRHPQPKSCPCVISQRRNACESTQRLIFYVNLPPITSKLASASPNTHDHVPAWIPITFVAGQYDDSPGIRGVNDCTYTQRLDLLNRSHLTILRFNRNLLSSSIYSAAFCGSESTFLRRAEREHCFDMGIFHHLPTYAFLRTSPYKDPDEREPSRNIPIQSLALPC